jgi:signal transduction histidine kinase
MRDVMREALKVWLLFGCFVFLLARPAQGQPQPLTGASHIAESLPIVPIAQVVADHPARIRANVEEMHPAYFVARDFSGVITVESTTNGIFGLGSTIEASGYATEGPAGLVLTRPTVIVPTTGNHALPVLNTVAQIRNLPAPEAERGFPVSVRGVVTYYESDSAEKLQFVQDGTAGIYIGLGSKESDGFPPAGTSIDVSGFTSPGGFAPIIEAEAVRAMGPGQWPEAPPVNSQLLMLGAEDSQWIKLNGVVRSITKGTNRTLVSLATGDGVVQVIVLDSGDHKAPANLIGASIEACGVCRTLFDDRRHLTGIGLCVPGWDQVQVKAAEQADPFQLPPGPISGLFKFHAGGYGVNRYHVRGRIILRLRNGAFFLQDASGGILVQPLEAVPVDHWIEVVGFPALKDQLPVLQDALVRPSPQAAPPAIAPLPLAADSALDVTLNSRLVTLDGLVLAHSYSAGEETVTLQFGQRLTDAIMEKSPGQSLPQFVPDSTVRFTGVYVAKLDNNRQIQSFQILLRSPRDAVVVSVPLWWTARHALYVFGALAGVLLLSLAWVAGLREQVRRRTAQLREEIEERKRMEAQVEKAHRELREISRKNGMAEVATSVLHNVGNVLNSVNVSASLLRDNTKKSSVSFLTRAVALFNEHSTDLGHYLANDPKGKQLPGYLNQVSEQLVWEEQQAIAELESLRQNIDHINEIVAMQQNYAKVSGVAETVKVTDLVEDALRLNEGVLASHQIKLIRNYTQAPAVVVEKYKAVEILVNLIQNAANALVEGGTSDKKLTVQVGQMENGRARISIIDNGIGIAAENLTRIFAHGFTTRAGGHGFGLHSGWLSAREMGGSLNAFSDGPGTGAAFVLEFPAVPVARLQPV